LICGFAIFFGTREKLTCGLHHWLPTAAAPQRISETQRGTPVSRQQGGALIFYFQFGKRLRLKG